MFARGYYDMNILLVGEESAGIRALQTLAQSRHRIVGVAASPSPKYGSPVTLWDTAKKLGIRTWAASTVKDPAFVEQIRAENVDVLLNLHSLYLINEEIVRAPKIGSFNLHPGPLPRYAGLNPVSWALYSGEKTHGVTLHWMTGQIDGGPIVYQSIFPITAEDTAFSVSVRCIKEGLQMLGRLLETLEADPTSLPQIPQNLSQRQYYGRGVPHQGCVVWSRPAEQVVNFVHACDFHPFVSPWGTPKTRKGDVEIQVVKVAGTGLIAGAAPGTVSSLDSHGLVVACRDEWVRLGKIRVQDRFMNPAEVLEPGDYLESGECN